MQFCLSGVLSPHWLILKPVSASVCHRMHMAANLASNTSQRDVRLGECDISDQTAGSHSMSASTQRVDKKLKHRGHFRHSNFRSTLQSVLVSVATSTGPRLSQ